MSSSTREALWEAIRRDFRRACRLRLEGRLEEAGVVMNGSLQDAVQQWQHLTKQADEPCREPLEQMFREEVKRVEDAWAVWEIMQEQTGVETQAQLREEVRALREQLKDLSLDMQIAGHQVRKAVKATLPPFGPAEKGTSASLPTTEPVPEPPEPETEPDEEPPPHRRVVRQKRRPAPAEVETTGNRIPFGNIPAIIDHVLQESSG